MNSFTFLNPKCKLKSKYQPFNNESVTLMLLDSVTLQQIQPGLGAGASRVKGVKSGNQIHN